MLMKKLLSLFGAFGLILGVSTSIISCKKANNDKDKPDKPNQDKPNQDKPNQDKPDKPDKPKPNIENLIKEFIQKIEKDFLLSGNSYINWEEIKGDKSDYKGYGNESINQLKTKNLNDFKNRLINFIKDKKSEYFNEFDSINIIDSNIEFSYDDKQSVNFIELFENKSSENFINYDANGGEEGGPKGWRWEVFEAIFRKKSNNNYGDNDNKRNDNDYINFLQKRYFTNGNLKKWNDDFLELKKDYLKNQKFDENQISTINSLNSYKYADSIGKLNVSGLKIIFVKDEINYDYQIDNFDLFFTYNIVNVKNKKEEEINDKKSKLLSEFSIKDLINNFKDKLKLNDNYKKFGEDGDWLFTIGNKEYVDKLKELEPSDKNLYNLFKELNSLPDFQESILSNVNKLLKNQDNGYVIWANFNLNNSEEKDKFLNFVNYKTIDQNYESTRGFNTKNDGVFLVKNKDSYSETFITFKLGYLAININVHFLFSAHKDELFIKFK